MTFFKKYFILYSQNNWEFEGIPKRKALRICRQCQAIHDGKKWHWDENLYKQLKGTPWTKVVICSACRRKRDKVVHGVVYLSGKILAENPDEVRRLIRHEEQIELAKNHLSQILDIDHRGQKMTITTINQWLAIHLGKQLKKTFKGHLKIHRDPFSKEEAVVQWSQEP